MSERTRPDADAGADGRAFLSPAERVETALSADPFGGPVEGMSGATRRRITVDRLLRHKWLALSVFLAASVPLSAAVWLFYVPQYRAEAAVLVSPRIPRIAFRTDDNGQIPNYRQHLNTEATKLRDPVVLNRVLERADVQQTKWYRKRPMFELGGRRSLLDRLRDELDARAARDSSYIFLSMECPDAGEAKLIVNAVIQEYERYVAQEFNEDDDVVLRVLEEKLDNLYLDTKTLRSDIASMLESSGLYTEDPDALVQQQRLRLDTKEADLQNVRSALEIAAARLTSPESTNTVASPDPNASEKVKSAEPTLYSANPEWRRLNEGLKSAELAVELARERFGDSHTEMIRLRRAAEYSRDKLAQHEAELDSQGGLPPLETGGARDPATGAFVSRGTLKTHMEDLQTQEKILEKEVAREHQRLRETTRKVQDLNKKREELRRLEGQLEILRENEIAMKTEKERPPAIKTREAFRPSQPVNGKRRYMLMGMAVFGGLALALATTYLRASTNPAVYEAGEFLGPVDAPFLGHLPWVRDQIEMSSEQETAQAEYVRMVRTALLERVEGRRSVAVLITSAGAGAGKTTFAMSLAESLARCGKHVLLVDTDLRNPTLSKRCNLAAGPGLVGVLTDQAGDADAIRKNGVKGLEILPAGPTDQTHDPELLANGVFSASLNRWRERYDVILLDAPPVIPVADARIIARQVDGTVLVVREGHCRRGEVIEALAMISATGSRLLGTVFAGSHPRRGYASYYSRYYRAEADTAYALDTRDA